MDDAERAAILANAPRCIQCGQRPAMRDRHPRARLCATCFLKALDLAFYEMDKNDGQKDENDKDAQAGLSGESGYTPN